jgi:prevent-host-death family protein
MQQVTLKEADGQLSQLIDKALHGEEIVITQDSKPLVKLVPVQEIKPRRQPGSAQSIILHIAEDFDAPLDDFKDYE